MKKIVTISVSAMLAWASQAAPLVPINVAGSNITCMLSTNCNVVTNGAADTFHLPNSTGEGVLESIVFAGQSNAPGSNLFSYLYRIDLSGVTALNSNLQGCVTNVVICQSNGPTLHTNLSCVTNVLLGLTNIACSTNVTTNALCVTNSVPCPGATPCIESFQIRAGPAVSMLVTGTNGVLGTGQVFVVTSGGTGTVGVASVQQTGTVLTVNFASPICPGSSSLFFGIVSSNAPNTEAARLLLNSGRSVIAGALAPSLAGLPINCDFSALSNAIAQLGNKDLLAPNSHAREGRRGALLDAVNEATQLARQGNLKGVLDALEGITAKATHEGKWFSDAASAQLRGILTSVLDCLGQQNGSVGHGDNKDADADEDGQGKGQHGDGHGHENGQGQGQANGHRK